MTQLTQRFPHTIHAVTFEDFVLKLTACVFLSVIAAELLQLTYLHRTQPEATVDLVLNPTQIAVLKTKSSKPPKLLTVAWTLEAVARLGGYLDG